MIVTLATPGLKQNSESNPNAILINVNNILKKKKKILTKNNLYIFINIIT